MAGNPNWEPGKSGNPGGRPKMSAEEREAWQALSTKCRSKLEAIADKEDTPPAIIVKIADLATDRGYGKAAQSIALEGKDGDDLFKAFSDINESEVYAKAGIDKPKL